jgi:hypothetical protein
MFVTDLSVNGHWAVAERESHTPLRASFLMLPKS